MWPLEGAMIQSLCVDWRKALRCVWSVNNRTHCDIITSLSNQFPLILRLKKRFIKFIINCLVSQNNIVKIISQVAICNPMSNTGSNYRCTSDSDCKLSIKSNMNDWHIISDNVCTKIDVLYYRFIVRFPIGLDFLFITFTFLLHLLLSWRTSSLSISSSAISASTLSNHVFFGLPTSLLPSTLYPIHFISPSPHHLFPYISSPSPHHLFYYMI